MAGSYAEYKKEMGTKAKGKKKRNKKEKTKKIKTKGKTKAKKVAEKTLKENLRQEYQVSLTVDGSTKYTAGMIVKIDNSFGKFEGKYIIEKVTHSITGDYTCDLELLKVGARENATEKAKQQTRKEQEAKRKGRERKKTTNKSNKANKKK